MMISKGSEWKRTVLHDKANPKGVDIIPEGDPVTDDLILESIGTKEYSIIELDHANCIIIYDAKSEGDICIAPSMMSMAFGSKNAQVIKGKCIITNATYLR